MGKKRRTFSSKQKKEIALAAIRERESMSAIASKYSVHPNQVSQWKKTALQGLEQAFIDKRKQEKALLEQTKLTEELYSEIGRLKMELKWLKKKVDEFE